MTCSRLTVLCCFLAFPVGVLAQPVAPGATSAKSFSGQFVINAEPPTTLRGRLSFLDTNASYFRIDAKLLPVSCERIKQILNRELGLPGAWNGKIFVSVHRAISEGENVALLAERFNSGWQYRVDLPDIVQRDRYARALTQALLLEIANRQAGARSAELPRWLIEGFTQRLLTLHQSEIILSPATSTPSGITLASTLISARRSHPLENAHKDLCLRGPMSFDQLSWPDPEDLSPDKLQHYGNSAHLFLNELLKLRNGPERLSQMIFALPRYYNWQFAFMEAFPEFQTPLDVEKWWTLQVLHFTGRDFAQTWTLEVSLQKLQQAFRVSVQVRSGANELPASSEVPLQTVLRQWQPPQQSQVLDEKVRELQLLRMRLAEDLLPMIDELQRVLQLYVRESKDPGFLFWRNSNRQRAGEDAARQVDALLTRCLQLQATAGSATATPLDALTRAR